MNMISKLKMFCRVLGDTLLISLHYIVILALATNQAILAAIIAALWTSYVLDLTIRSYRNEKHI